MKKDPFQLLIATNNPGKIVELNDLLSDLPVNLRSLQDFPKIPDVEETGTTFEENAILKAQSYAKQTGLFAVADDSGLEVEALNGEPGVFSARYAGENATNEEKIKKLLQNLEKSGDKQRKAKFVCVMAISDEKGEIKFLAKGICRGKIARTPYGINGFGYDPIFIPDGFEQTFGELSGKIKRKLSHRAEASAKIIRFLHDFIAI